MNAGDARSPAGPPTAHAARGPGERRAAPLRLEPAVRIRCGRCDTLFAMSSRNVSAARARGDELSCGRCRGPRRATPPATLAYRDYWLDRFTLDEIRELAAGIWPQRS